MTTKLQSDDKVVSKTFDGSTGDKKWIKFTPPKKGSESSSKNLSIPDLDIASLILFEDNHMLVLNKPPVVLTQGDASGSSNLLDTAKEFLVLRGKKTGAAFLGASSRTISFPLVICCHDSVELFYFQLKEPVK
jgi:23S rRNA-/tRNA-specific pseudouridylate synthase